MSGEDRAASARGSWAVVVTSWVPLTHNNEEPARVYLFATEDEAKRFAVAPPQVGDTAYGYVIAVSELARPEDAN